MPSSAARRLLATARPLLGVRVLDLTRVIAGPVATRFLASLGAQILRLDPPPAGASLGWTRRSPAAIAAPWSISKAPRGAKRCAACCNKADVLVHGYRADALERLGFDAEARAPGAGAGGRQP
ncbi:acyl-CoA transferase|nr:CoA transferase [Candidatus Pantoea persica]MBA2814529.1 acyl-CoA transferase [Candidatus Pantoea persica]